MRNCSCMGIVTGNRQTVPRKFYNNPLVIRTCCCFCALQGCSCTDSHVYWCCILNLNYHSDERVMNNNLGRRVVWVSSNDEVELNLNYLGVMAGDKSEMGCNNQGSVPVVVGEIKYW